MLILRKPSFSAAYSVVHLAPVWSFGVCSNIVSVKLQAISAWISSLHLCAAKGTMTALYLYYKLATMATQNMSTEDVMNEYAFYDIYMSQSVRPNKYNTEAEALAVLCLTALQQDMASRNQAWKTVRLFAYRTNMIMWQKCTP